MVVNLLIKLIYRIRRKHYYYIVCNAPDLVAISTDTFRRINGDQPNILGVMITVSCAYSP